LAAPTDDASGPALYQPYIPTPIPPRSSTIPPAPASSMPLIVPQHAPVATLPVPSILVLNREAFYHPPAPPAYAPARPRRNAFGAFAIAFVAPLVAVALVMGWLTYAKSIKVRDEAVSTTTTRAAVVAPVKLETPVVTPAPSAKPDAPEMLVVEVKSLKSAPSPRKSRR
jgi:hypothetical protein